MSAWTVIAHTEVGSSNAANITFSSIAGTYTDLLVKASLRVLRSTSNYQRFYVRYNGNTGTSYFTRRLYGDGSSAYVQTNGGDSQSLRLGESVYNLATSNTFSNVEFYIPNYASSVAKVAIADSVTENNATDASASIFSGMWNNTSAITSIALFDANGSDFMQYSSATLYGITKGSSGGVTVS